MALRKTWPGDLLFGTQAVLAFIFGYGQFVRMLDSIQGVSGAMFFYTLLFLVLNLWLAISSYRNKPTRETVQIVAIYVIGLIIYAPFVALMAWKGGFGGGNDLTSTAAVLVGVMLTSVWAWRKGLNVKDPMVRGFLAVSFKALPQFLMAVKILEEGGGGVSATMIVIFHVLTCMRFGVTFIAVLKTGLDRNLRGILLAEGGNELSWLAVTAAWLLS